MALTTPVVLVVATEADVPAHVALARAMVAAATAPAMALRVMVQAVMVPAALAATVQPTITPGAVTVDIAAMVALVLVVLALSLTQLIHLHTNSLLSQLNRLHLRPMRLVPRLVTITVLRQHASV